MKDENRKNDLEERLVGYAVGISNVSKKLPESKSSQRIRAHLLICGSSPLSSYGDALKSESKSDYIQKIVIPLRELRESKEWLEIIHQTKLLQSSLLVPLIKEADELIASLSQEA